MTSRITIGITQRVLTIPERGERWDSLDQAYISFSEACGLNPLIIPNTLSDPVSFVKDAGIKGLIFTGGNNLSKSIKTINNQSPRFDQKMSNVAPERDITETILLKASIKYNWPVLGICRGMQLINVFYGGQITKISGHAGCNHALTSVKQDNTIFSLMFNNIVNSYHDYGILFNDVADDFEILAFTENFVEAFIHKKYQHMGIMWHPERVTKLSPNDISLIQNFFNSPQ